MPQPLVNFLDDDSQGQPGVLFPTGQGWPYSTFVAPASTARVSRGVLKRERLIGSINVGVSANATNDDASGVAIYDSNGQRLATSGRLTGKMNAGSVILPRNFPLTAPILLKPELVYYAMFIYGLVGGTAATIVSGNYGTVVAARLAGGGLPFMEADTIASATDGLPPASFAASGAGGGTAPALFLVDA